MEEVKETGGNHCPDCGAYNNPGAKTCWHCRFSLDGSAPRAVERPRPSKPVQIDEERIYIGPAEPPKISALAAWMVFIAAVTVFLAFTRVHVYLGFAAIGIAVPAGIATYRLVRKRNGMQDPMDLGEIIFAFIARVFMTVLAAFGLLLALAAALFVVCSCRGGM